MSDPLEYVLAEALRAEGWTCEYHEPTGRSGECAQCDATMAKTARRMIEKIRERWHVVEKVPVVTSEDGSARIPVETDRPQDNPHLRIEPVDQWGDRIIRPLGIPDPYRGPIKARRIAAALLSAADVAELWRRLRGIALCHSETHLPERGTVSAELSPYADMADTLDHLDLIVREHRRARRMSLREAGKSSGVDHSAIRRIEMGHSATLKTVAALLRWMDGGS